MENFELNNMLHGIRDTGESVDFSNENDIATVFFVEQTGNFLFVFNAVAVFSNKDMRTFRNKLSNFIQSKGLTVSV